AAFTGPSPRSRTGPLPRRPNGLASRKCKSEPRRPSRKRKRRSSSRRLRFRLGRRGSAGDYNGEVMLRITGGKVYDPANGVHGEVRDVCISDGRIVSNVEGGRTLDANGMVIFPGGVDIHTHVAGAALNFARGLTPENQRR